MTTTTIPPAARRILGDGLADALLGAFETMEQAEEEIGKARAAATTLEVEDRIWHAFHLLVPQLPMTEVAYRAHCHELLARVAEGQDTRPATAAEHLTVLCEASQVAPLTTAAAGLYARMWRRAGMPAGIWDDRDEHYEALEGAAIDDLERTAGRKLRQASRVAGPIEHARMCPYSQAAGGGGFYDQHGHWVPQAVMS